jgi:chemotaxis protein CheX
MPIHEDEINQLVEGIWDAVLGRQAQRVCEAALLASCEKVLTACVPITGAWEGTVQLRCGDRLARQTAAAMLGLEEGELTTDLIHDALGELANILGGNVKSLLSEPCCLCLPMVAADEDDSVHVPPGQVLIQTAFESHGRPFLVSIIEHTG